MRSRYLTVAWLIACAGVLAGCAPSIAERDPAGTRLACSAAEEAISQLGELPSARHATALAAQLKKRLDRLELIGADQFYALETALSELADSPHDSDEYHRASGKLYALIDPVRETCRAAGSTAFQPVPQTR